MITGDAGEVPGQRQTMVMTGFYKLVMDSNAEALQLFNMQEDPLELLNLAGREDMLPVELELRQRILKWRLETDNVQGEPLFCMTHLQVRSKNHFNLPDYKYIIYLDYKLTR